MNLDKSGSMKVALVYMFFIIIAEVITLIAPTVWAVWGIALYLVILLALIVHSALARGLTQPNRQLILSLALVPLVRIISMTMPLMSIPQILWYPVIYTPLAAAAVAFLRIPGYKLADIGFKSGFVPVQLAVALSGFVLGITEYLILRPEPMVSQMTLQQVWLYALIFLFFIGFVEEFIFRGVLQKTALDAFGTPGIIYVSFLFAILHMGFKSWLDVLFVFAVALFFAWIVRRTGSLLGVVLAHGLTNIMLYLVAPFLF